MSDSDSIETTSGTERLVAFSDGVFAVAITLLVLDVRLPDLPAPVSNAALTTALVSILPKIGGYVLSFLVVGEFWYLHHLRFRYIHRCDTGPDLAEPVAASDSQLRAVRQCGAEPIRQRHQPRAV